MESWKCDICDKSFTGIVCFKQHEASEKHKKKVGLMNAVNFENPKTLDPPSSINQFHCPICKVSISGWDNYQKHVNSIEHAIMVQKKNNDFLSSSVSSTFELKTEQNQLIESTVYLTGSTNAVASFTESKPCQKQFSGPEPYQQHLASAGHRKKCGSSTQIMYNDETDSIVRKDNIDDNMSYDHQSSVSTSKTEQNQLMESTLPLTGSIKVVAPFAECKPCQKQFSGPEPYQQHLASAGHRKKCVPSTQIMQVDETDSIVKKDNINDNLSYDPQSSISTCNLSETVPQYFAKCDICEMQFSGAVPYQIHLVSDGHKMKVGNQSLGNSIAEGQSAFKCDICVMSFTGPVPYKQHLVSNGHKKKISSTDLSKKLAATVSLSSPDCTLKDSEQSSINDLQKWYCDICKKQCSGPIPYNTHIVGREHSKNLRILLVEENLRKIKASGPLPYVGNNVIGSDLSNEVSSTMNLHSGSNTEMEESSVKINDLNINVKSDNTKILSDKFQMNMNDLIALPNLNIIPPEKLDVTVFEPDDEILFSSPKKCIQEFLSERKEVKNVT